MPEALSMQESNAIQNIKTIYSKFLKAYNAIGAEWKSDKD